MQRFAMPMQITIDDRLLPNPLLLPPRSVTAQPQNVFLRQLSPRGTAGLQTPPYALPGDREVVLGRDPLCQIVLNDNYRERSGA